VSPYETVLERLEEAGLEGQATYTGGYTFQCPAHEDNRASLSVAEGDDGRALVYCFAGCKTEEVIKALGLTWAELFNGSDRVPIKYYVYHDWVGEPLIRVTRFEPKGFTQHRWEDGKWVAGLNGVSRVPYRLPFLIESDGTIYITEGERDADTLAALGYTATTFLGGAGKWRDEYAQWFKDRDVVVCADKDDPGREGAARIARALGSTVSDV